MISFNVCGYRLKSTNIVAMEDITDFKDIRDLTGLSNTRWIKAYIILFTRFNLSPVLALMQCILSLSVTITLKSCLYKTGWRRVSWKETEVMISITLKLNNFRGISVSIFLCREKYLLSEILLCPYFLREFSPIYI